MSRLFASRCNAWLAVVPRPPPSFEHTVAYCQHTLVVWIHRTNIPGERQFLDVLGHRFLRVFDSALNIAYCFGLFWPSFTLERRSIGDVGGHAVVRSWDSSLQSFNIDALPT